MSSPTRHGPSRARWQPVPDFDDVWELRRSHGPLPLRATAVRLEDGAVCVYSPVPRAGEVALQELESFGAPVLFAPNAFHTLGLREHASALPNSAIVASGRAFGRIKRRTGLSIQDLRLLEAKLPSHISVVQLPDVRSGEAWLSVRSTARCGWIVGDAFLNFVQLPRGPIGLGMRLLRMGPGLSIGSTFKLMIEDKPAYRDWLLAKIAEDRPTVLIPCHGGILVDDGLPQRLDSLVKRRIPAKRLRS